MHACRSSLLLVCKRWRSLLLSDPEAWHCLAINDGCLRSLHSSGERARWFEHKRVLLGRHAGQLTALDVRGGALLDATPGLGPGAPHPGPPDPQPAGCQWLGSLLEQLQLAGRLGHLSLEWSPLLPPAPLVELRRRGFPALASLELEAAQLPPDTADALARLSALASLRCRVGRVQPWVLAAAAAPCRS